MKANSKRKVFGDAVDLLMGDMEEVTMPRGVQMLPVKSIQPFHDHPFHLYEGERLDESSAVDTGIYFGSLKDRLTVCINDARCGSTIGIDEICICISRIVRSL